VFGAFDQVVDAPLAQQVGFLAFSVASRAITRSRIHPVDAVYPLLPACCLQLTLEFLLGTLLFEFIDALLGALALGEGLLFLIVDGGLVASQSRMERLLQIQISATHGCDSLSGGDG
jgi:hypothetical protein